MIHIASDHAGYALKEAIKEFLERQGIHVKDHGPFAYDKVDDYPDFVIPAVEAAIRAGSKAIILGHSGQGEAIAANKVKGARAVVYYGGSLDIIRLSREHNDANVLSLGAGFLSEEDAFQAVKQWLSTPFSGEERHSRRLAKIERYEDERG